MKLKKSKRNHMPGRGRENNKKYSYKQASFKKVEGKDKTTPNKEKYWGQNLCN